jgi:hypothetical protein
MNRGRWIAHSWTRRKRLAIYMLLLCVSGGIGVISYNDLGSLEMIWAHVDNNGVVERTITTNKYRVVTTQQRDERKSLGDERSITSTRVAGYRKKTNKITGTV